MGASLHEGAVLFVKKNSVKIINNKLVRAAITVFNQLFSECCQSSESTNALPGGIVLS